MAFASAHIPVTGDERGLDPLGFVLIVVAAFALSFERRHPKPVLAVVTTALAVFILRQYVGGPIYVTGWLARLSQTECDSIRHRMKHVYEIRPRKIK